MAIQLRLGSSLDLLSKELIADLATDKPGVFDKQWVVTPTDGINNWLRQELAVRTGIAANLQFTRMNDILQLLYYWICPDDSLLIDKDSMTWAIFAELNEPDFCTTFPAIAAYYTDSESRRAALAAEMADLFDQYQVYRNDKVAAWKDGTAIHDEATAWQSYLWERMKIRLGDGYADRLDISKRLLAKLADEEAVTLIKRRMPNLRFFGLAIVTPYYLELFRVLSGIIDVKFYLLNPCPDDLWMDDLSNGKIARLRNRPGLLEHRKAGNELLVNWGKVLRDSYSLILTNDEYVNRYEVAEADTDHEPATLLNQVQYDIIHNLNNDSRTAINPDFLSDGSFKVNGCFTPIREVEVLYNYLLDVFSKDPGLGARDVLVMVNDIDTYAPFIRAVFDNAPVELPYSIADESVANGNSLFKALTDILSVNADTFKSEEVLSLLDSPFIRRRFGFSDIAAVRQAVREAGIYFGTMNEAPVPGNADTEAWMVSWDYGLEKIMYGLCISGEPLYTEGSHPLYPLDTAEGAAMADRIRLYHFIQVLKAVLGERAQPRNVAGWADYLGNVMSEMILDEDEENEDFPRFANLLASITAMDEVMNGGTIAYTTFKQVFFSRLDLEKRANRYVGKGINFCSLVPMRSVPFRVIALLGMNFDSFPRQDSALSFSLLGREQRPGDRSVRENDKHLLLETILAAKERLYISFIARDVLKGTAMPPSALVDELLDYIALKSPDAAAFKKAAVCIHPLHVFSTKYTDPANGLPPNYVGNTLATGWSFTRTAKQDSDATDQSVISLDKLISFIKHPVKYFFNSRLGIYYRDEEERIAETELFEIDHLQGWSIKDQLLRTDITIDEFINRGKRTGQLPLANMGNVLVEQLGEDIAAFKTVLEELIAENAPESVQLRYTSGSTTVEGSITLYGSRYIYVANTSSPLRHIMDPWIRYLVTIVQGEMPVPEFYFIYKVNDNPSTFRLAPGEINADTAKAQLDYIINAFLEGNKAIFPFYPSFGYYYFKTVRNGPPALRIDREDLYIEYENSKDRDYHRVFTDGGYLEKVIEDEDSGTGFFSNDAVAALQDHVRFLLTPLFDKCPSLFKLNK